MIFLFIGRYTILNFKKNTINKYLFKILTIFRAKKWDEEMTDLEINSGITVQHYGHTVIMLVESKLRGFTCGLCGNFNSENSDESNETPKCVQL